MKKETLLIVAIIVVASTWICLIVDGYRKTREMLLDQYLDGIKLGYELCQNGMPMKDALSMSEEILKGKEGDKK